MLILNDLYSKHVIISLVWQLLYQLGLNALWNDRMMKFGVGLQKSIKL